MCVENKLVEIMKDVYDCIPIYEDNTLETKIYLEELKVHIEKYFIKRDEDGKRPIVMNTINKLMSITDLENKSILDVGCGWLTHSLYFALVGMKVFSIDFDVNKMRICEKINTLYCGLNSQNGWGGNEINTYNMDATNLNIADNSVDIVYMNQFISHTPDLTKSFKEAKRVLKDGGLLFVCDSDKNKAVGEYYYMKYGRLYMKIYNFIDEIIGEYLQKHKTYTPLHNKPKLIDEMFGLNRKQIENILTEILMGVDVNILNIPKKFPLMNPNNEYYYERLFAPDEIKVRLEKLGFEIKDTIEWGSAYYIGGIK